jgi:hypothetical protein
MTFARARVAAARALLWWASLRPRTLRSASAASRSRYVRQRRTWRLPTLPWPRGAWMVFATFAVAMAVCWTKPAFGAGVRVLPAFYGS